MNKGINRAIIIGHLGQDPEVRYTQGGSAITSISIATSESWKDKNTGQMQEKTEWHRVSFFGKLAEIAGEYLRKGSQVYVEGKLQTRKWKDKQGQDRYYTEINARELNILSEKPNANQKAVNHGNAIQKGRESQKPEDNGFDDSDLPF